MPHRIGLGACLIALVALTACRTTYYELDLRPYDNVIDRRLTLWIDADNEGEYGTLSKELVTAIAGTYGEKVPEDLSAMLEFRGRFGPDMPTDIGGSGSYHTWTSTLGSVHYYIESFRGNDDLAASLDAMLAMIDSNVDALATWLADEYAGTARIDDTIAAVRGVIRDDLRNLVLYAWVSGVTRERAFDDEELLQRCIAYLVRRGYFAMGDAPALGTALTRFGAADADNEPLSALLARAIARRMELDPGGQLPPVLAALGKDAQTFFESFESYAEVHDIGSLEELNDIDLFGPSYNRLRVVLQVPVEPITTNGEWDGISRISWDERLASRSDGTDELPNQVFALWTIPASSYQGKRLGAAILNGEDLLVYVLWRNTLSESRGAEWDALLDSLDGGKNAAARIREFRFSDAGDDPEAGHVDDVDAVANLLEKL